MADEEKSWLDFLSVPLEYVKEKTSGDKGIWFGENFDSEGKQRMPHEMWALGQVAGDLVLDPLNATGGAAKLLTKGTPVLRGAVGSASNYINNFYGPGRNPVVPEFLKDATDLQKAAYLKAKGLKEWGKEGVKNFAEHLVDPRSRAMANQYGISAPSARLVGKHLDNKGVDPRATEKAVSQVQYSAHQNQQGYLRPKGNGRNDAMDEIVTRSNIEGYQKASPKSMSEAFQRNPVTVEGTGEAVSMSAKDSDFLAEYIYNKQGKPGQFVVKSPVAKETGGHHHDVVFNNPAKGAAGDAFKELGDTVSPQDLAKALRAKQGLPKYTPSNPKDSWQVLKVDDDGVWLKGSKVGSAVTEGGVMWLQKIKPNGETMTVMADSHDFLEKIGGKTLAPKGLVAVTPPMFNNIKNVNKSIKMTPERTFKQVPPRRGATRGKDTYETLLREIANLSPTGSEVARQSVGMAGEGLLGLKFAEANQGQDRGAFDVTQNAAVGLWDQFK